MTLQGVAAETMEIIERGRYLAPSGRTIEVGALVARAVEGTVLHRPADGAALLAGVAARAGERSAGPRVEVTEETTCAAARRLVAVEGASRVAALNFASAKNPGGGFLRGAVAQEEDLARCSALYRCQLAAPEYYSANRACRSMLYTDHIIYSPDVPFFRDDHLALLEEPYVTSVITAPAPNAGAISNKRDRRDLGATLESRAERVLAVAAHHGHRVLVLGAWGCGVFRNDPAAVAAGFRAHLVEPRWAAAFDRVVFAVFDRSKTRSVLAAFRAAFDSAE